MCCSQNQELGVRGQPDRRPDGPLRAARRARHHVHHPEGRRDYQHLSTHYTHNALVFMGLSHLQACYYQIQHEKIT